MKYSLPTSKMSVQIYYKQILDVDMPGTLEQAGPLVYPGTYWTLEDYNKHNFLSQPLRIRKNALTSEINENGYVYTPLSGVLFVKGSKLELYTSYPKYTRRVWWPFPAPLNPLYDNLLEHQHIRPFPGLFTFSFEGLNDTLANKVRSFISRALALIFYREIFHSSGLEDDYYPWVASVAAASNFTDKVNVIKTIYNDIASSNDSEKKDFFENFVKNFIVYNDTEGFDATETFGDPGPNQLVDLVKHDPRLVSDFNKLVEAILIYRQNLGIRVPVSTPLIELTHNEVVLVSSKDWRCYAHPFKPIAILQGGISTKVGDYDGVFLRSDFPRQVPATVDLSSLNYTNYIGQLKSGSGGFSSSQSGVTGWQSAYNETRLVIYDLNEKDKKITEEQEVILTVADGTNESQVQIVKIDKYEKWSLFDSNIRAVYAHWYTSGFLSNAYKNDNLILGIVSQRYDNNKSLVLNAGTEAEETIRFHQIELNDEDIYFHKPYAFEPNSESQPNGRKIMFISNEQFLKKSDGTTHVTVPNSIGLPEPKNYNFIEINGQNYKTFGEKIGQKIKTLDYDMSQHKIRFIDVNAGDYLIKTDIREYENSVKDNDYAGDFYAGNLGAYGLEEYVIRVPFTEIPNMLANGDGTNNVNLGKNLLKNIELLKAKIIITRTFHMGRSISERKFSHRYEKINISTTADGWQVMTLGKYNTIVREITDAAVAENFRSSEIARLTIEEALYETWGEVFLHKGVVVQALFKGNTNAGGVRGDRAPTNLDLNNTEHKKYITRDYNALRRVYTPAGHSDSLDGAGFAQQGGEVLSKNLYASAHQIIHWYFYGCHIINAWGHGDCVSRFPDPVNTSGAPNSENAFPWLAWKSNLEKIDLPSLKVYTDSDGIWKLHNESVLDAVLNTTASVKYENTNGETFRTDAEVWGLGVKGSFDANVFNDTKQQNSGNQLVDGFEVSRKLISALNHLTYALDPDESLIVLSNNKTDNYQSDVFYWMQIRDPKKIHALQINVGGSYVTPTDELFTQLGFKDVTIQSDKLVIQGARVRLVYRSSSTAINKEDLNKVFSFNNGESFWLELRNKYNKRSKFYLVRVP